MDDNDKKGYSYTDLPGTGILSSIIFVVVVTIAMAVISYFKG